MQWREHMNDVSPLLVDAVLKRAVKRTYERGRVLFHEGDHPDGMYLVEDGRALIQASTIEGAAVGLDVADPGAVVGEQALLRPDVARNASVTAIRELKVLLVRPREFASLRDEHPQIDRFIVRVLDERLREMSGRLAEAVHASAEERVCRRLAALAQAFDGSVRMSQQKLAAMAGTTRPTVNRVLQDLARSEVVELGRSRVDVIDLARLEASSGSFV